MVVAFAAIVSLAVGYHSHSTLSEFYASQPVALICTIAEVKVGEPGDVVDATTGDLHDANYFVRLKVDRVLKGEYAKPELGLRLHSPSLMFGFGLGSASVGARHVLLFNLEKTTTDKPLLIFRDTRPYYWSQAIFE